MAVGLSYEDPAVKLLNDGANIKVVYPKEGTVFLPASAAIVKKSKNPKFQVEVSHPKEIHLATCSPSIF
ncbi:iron ABC transporter iron-binding protein [Streptococcus pneumoniae]|nr:iron ABC transporter iron-binding protein [Streptococcus pneumoniae]